MSNWKDLQSNTERDSAKNDLLCADIHDRRK